MTENEHTHLLFQLLNLKFKNGTLVFFDFLKKCCPKIASKTAFAVPSIKDQVDYMDILVRENDSALIIESKIKGEEDGLHQIAHYIKKEIDDGCKLSKIFVVHITDEEPQNHTLGKYEEDIAPRYVRVSKKEMLEWLKIMDGRMDNKHSLKKDLQIAIADLQADLEKKTN